MKVRTIDSDKNLVFVQRKSKFEKIQKMVSIESIELYHDSQKIKNIEKYDEYLAKNRSKFEKLFSVQLVIYVDINPYNKTLVEKELKDKIELENGESTELD